MAIKTIQDLAAETAEWFTEGKRDKEEFVKLKDKAPQWIKDMVREAHEGMLPDDHKYDFVLRALYHISDTKDPDSPELEPDVYTGDLLNWLASNLERAGFVDEAVGELGHSEQGIIGDIMLGQVHEMEQVYSVALQAL